MEKNEVRILKEITIDNCIISFIEQPNKATVKILDSLHREIAALLLSEQYSKRKPDTSIA